MECGFHHGHSDSHRSSSTLNEPSSLSIAILVVPLLLDSWTPWPIRRLSHAHRGSMHWWPCANVCSAWEIIRGSTAMFLRPFPSRAMVELINGSGSARFWPSLQVWQSCHGSCRKATIGLMICPVLQPQSTILYYLKSTTIIIKGFYLFCSGL